METWRASMLGAADLLAASLLWGIVAALVLLSIGILSAKDVANVVQILFRIVVPGSVLVGCMLGYWVVRARPSPMGAASMAGIAAATINPLLAWWVVALPSTIPHGWLAAILSAAILWLTAAPFWFTAALVLYRSVNR